jgi:hypothetical protein
MIMIGVMAPFMLGLNEPRVCRKLPQKCGSNLRAFRYQERREATIGRRSRRGQGELYRRNVATFMWLTSSSDVAAKRCALGPVCSFHAA